MLSPKRICVGVRFRGPLCTRKLWLARILYGLTFSHYEPVVRGANWVFSELPQPMSRFHSAQLARLGFCAAGNARLGCRRADLSHLRTSAPVASREINWPRRLRTRRATRGTEPRRARDDRQSTSRPHVLHELDAEWERARAREFKPAALGASGHSLISVGCKKHLHRRATADGRERTDTSWVHRPASRSSIGAPK